VAASASVSARPRGIVMLDGSVRVSSVCDAAPSSWDAAAPAALSAGAGEAGADRVAAAASMVSAPLSGGATE
jgi:hypothetical protein